ncbi:Major_facilitator superfamily protein [Hexamita inflata]|uniref:Major facilitator superfamily protein n=1 Tax=Hexamita inflata TaxID=28002 RepID=A0AA86TH09_9EUKA|nr:Major facilitator superfamily protein [Hexamita inflata]
MNGVQLVTSTVNQNEEQPPTTKNKCKIQKYVAGTNSALITSLVVVPPQFIFTLLQISIDILSVDIAKTLNVSINYVQWLSHVENLVLCSICIIASKIQLRFGIQKCYILGSLFIAISNLLMFLFCTKLQLLLLFRTISAFGFGLVIPGTGAMVNILVKREQLAKTLSIADTVIPSAYFLATIIGGVVSQYLGWQYMFLFGSVIGIIHFIFVAIKLPIPAGNKEIQFNHIGIALLFFASASMIMSIGLITVEKIPYWVSGILFGCAIVMFVSFFVVNKNSQIKVIPIEVFNKNTIIFVISYLFVCTGYMADTFYQPVLWENIFKLSPVRNGLLIGLCKVLDICLIWLYSIVIKKLTIKLTLIIATSVLILVYITQLLALHFYLSIILIEILNIVSSGAFIQCQLACQMYNALGTPKPYILASGTLLVFVGKFSWSLGVAISTAVQQISQSLMGNKEEYLTSIKIAYISALIILCVGQFLVANVGIMSWERGKKGFSEKKLLSFSTYEELRENNPELGQVNMEEDEYTEKLWKWQGFGVRM